MVNSMSRAHLLRIAPLWVLALIVGSLLPDGAKTAIGTHMEHRLYHMLSFGSTAYLVFTLLARDARERIYALVFVVALGFGIEYLQHCIFHNVYEWWDVRDDGIGVLAAAVLTQWPALRQKLVRFD